MTNDTEELKQIGERILAVRKALGMLQNEFAQAMDVSSGSLSMMETGKNQPRFELLYNLAKKYKINLYYLFFGQGEMFLPPEPDDAIKEKKYGPETETWLRDFYRNFNESRFFRFNVMATVSMLLLEKGATIKREIEMNSNPDKK